MLRRFVICILLAVLGALTVLAADRETAILVVMEGVSVDQLLASTDPSCKELLSRAAVGLINNRTGESLSASNNAVTIGAGARARSELKNDWGKTCNLATWGFNGRELVWGTPAYQRFTRNTGFNIPDTVIINTEITALQGVNAVDLKGVYPGLLGSQLQRVGVKMAVYGNADQGAQPVRNGVSIAMNTQGWVPTGDVSNRTEIADATRPYGIRTNYAYLLERITELQAQRACIVVDAGDGSRLEAASVLLSDERVAVLRARTLSECSKFVTRLEDAIARRGDRYLLLFMPLTPDIIATRSGDQLTPLLMLGSEVHPGILTSTSTKRTGVVMNVDLAPTILRFFRATPTSDMVGGLIAVDSQRMTRDALRAANHKMVALNQGRPPVIKGYILVLACSVLAYVLLSLALRYQIQGIRITPASLRPLFLAVMLVPLILLIAPSLGIYRPLGTAAFLLVVTLFPAYVLCRRVRDIRWVLAGIGTLTAFVLCIDMLCGTPLLESSFLSYTVISGIRFYGLGNEYSGVLIGALLLGISAWLDIWKTSSRWLTVLLCTIYLLVLALIGSPRHGSDFGGMFAAIAGFSMVLGKLLPRRLLLKTALIAGLAGTLLAAFILALNMRMPSTEQTHIGQAFGTAQQEGVGVLWEIAVRKWAMNFKLIRSSWWAFALASMTVGLLALAYRPIDVVRRTLSPHPALNAGFIGILAAMCVALLTNDSGVVMAATGLLYLVFPLMLLVENDRGALVSNGE